MPALEQVDVGCSWCRLLLRGSCGWKWGLAGWAHLGARVSVLWCWKALLFLLLLVATELCFQKDRKPAVCCKSALFLKSDLCLPSLHGFGSIWNAFLLFSGYAIERGAGSLTRKYAICELSFKLFYQCWLLPGEMIPIYHNLREKRLGSSWMFHSRMKNEHEDS